MNEAFAKLPAPPGAERRPLSRTLHGVDVTDDYAWLRAENWQEVLRDPALLPAEIRTHLEAENAHAEAFFGPLAGLRKKLVAEMRGRIKEDDASVPLLDGPFAYFTRFRTGGEHPLVLRHARDEPARETLLIDGDAEAKGHPFFDLGAWSASRDHRLIAWSADFAGSELHDIRIRDTASGVDLEDVLRETTGEAVFDAASNALYYIRLDANHRPRKVFRHRLGEKQADDLLVYEEGDQGWFVHLDAPRDRRFALIEAGDHETSEVHRLDLRDPEAVPKLIWRRRPQVRYSVQPHRDQLIILTNDWAEDFKVIAAPLDDPAGEPAVLVPHRPGTLIVGMDVIEDHLITLERADALPQLMVRGLATGQTRRIAFAEQAYALSLGEGAEFRTSRIRYRYSSPTTPQETCEIDVISGEKTVLKRQEVPSGHDPALYETRRLFAEAADGARVPISLVRRRDRPSDGRGPLFLTGYGAYGIAIPARFNANWLSLLDRGFAVAIAHVRGGTEKGWAWYLGGKREKKSNTFTDFIAAAEALITVGETGPGLIVAQGGSAGGMLIGAIANLAPQLFAGIIADVPFVDVLNTMLDDTLPLTPPEWPEWGNPLEDAEAFAAIRSYSPYENVRSQPYPPILALAGLTDPRVTYWEPAKWVARLRARMTGGGPVLLHTNMSVGHGGPAGRFEQLEEVAMSYAFALAATERLRSA